MQAMWASMSENVKCVCKNSVDVLNTGDKVKCRGRPSHEACTGRISEHRPRRNSEHREASTTFVQLSKGDTSRNIVEMIYQAAVRDLKSERSMPVISQVFKVQNSIATRKRFEEHRDAVKKKECEKKGNRHSRVLVDGNELLQFYSTTISCNNCSETSQRAGLCKEFVCGVCKTIQTGFEKECKEKKGILLSASSEALTTKKRNVRRAVIVCRTIAGVMGYMNEKNEGCDSVRSVKGSKLDYLIVRNPRAVLPCFVIVFE